MDSAVVAALIASGAALLGAFLGGLVTFRISLIQQRAAAANLDKQLQASSDALSRELDASGQAQKREARIQFRQRQLIELYGPMYLERRRSEHLRRGFPEWEDHVGGTRWRLVDHIAEVKKDPDLKPIGEAILESGDKIVGLLRAFGGLLEPLPPLGAFSKFILHHEMLRMSWAAGKNQDPENRYPFPGRPPSDTDMSKCTTESAQGELDCAIWLGMRSVQADLEELLDLPTGTLTKWPNEHPRRM